MLTQTGPTIMKYLTMHFYHYFTDNSSEETSATAEKEEEMEESDHEGEPFTIKT